MRWWLFIAVLSVAQLSDGATYYVATNGNNSADGSSGTPWLTIGKAITNAVAGDTVIVGRGVYSEWLTNITSGTAGNPITFIGTRGAGGEWLTVIDPSTPITSWAATPEIGSGVYKSTGLPIVVRELTIDGKRVMGPNTLGTLSSVDSAYSGSGLTTGTNFFTLSSGATLTTVDGYNVTFWDSIGALYSTAGSTVYLRLRDGSDPTGLDIRGAPNLDASVNNDVHLPTILISGKSYITWSNFKFQRTFAAFLITGTGAHHLTIDQNYLQNGGCRLYLAAGAHDNLIRSNQFTVNYYGFDNLGGWQDASGTLYGNRNNTYLFCKFIHSSQDSSMDQDVNMYQGGNSNVVTGNIMFNGLGTGWNHWGDPAHPAYDSEFSYNIVSNHSSVGITLNQGCSKTKVYDNYVSDCNANFRFHNELNGDTDRSAYVYRNRSYLPDGVAHHIFFHFGGSDAYQPTNWIYQNSFSGGGYGWMMGATHPMSETRFFNNIFSDTVFVYTSTTFKNDASYLGAFDYNCITNYSPNPAWFGSHNIKSTTNQWVNAAGMSFSLPSGSQAIDAGLDLPSAYPLLPQTAITRSGSAWDIGAIELQPTSTATIGTAYFY